MESVKEYLPFLLPIIILQFALTISAIIHILKHDKFKFGNKPLWIILSFVQFIGPILYFFVGREEE